LALENITTPADLSLDTLATHTGGNWEITAKMHGKVFQLDTKRRRTKKKIGSKDGRFEPFAGGLA
jgi:hypothetical protein